MRLANTYISGKQESLSLGRYRITGDETSSDHVCGRQRLIGLPVAVEGTIKALQAAMFVSLWDRSPFEQPGCLQLQAAFTRLGIAFPIRLDNQTQAGVFTNRTNIAHGVLPQNTLRKVPSPEQRSVEQPAFCGKKAKNDLK